MSHARRGRGARAAPVAARLHAVARRASPCVVTTDAPTRITALYAALPARLVRAVKCRLKWLTTATVRSRMRMLLQVRCCLSSARAAVRRDVVTTGALTRTTVCYAVLSVRCVSAARRYHKWHTTATVRSRTKMVLQVRCCLSTARAAVRERVVTTGAPMPTNV